MITRPADPKGGLVEDNVSKLNEISSFTDGTSTTILIAEDAGRPAYYRAGKRVGDQVPGTGAGWADADSRFGLHGYSADGLNSPGPCAINCTNDAEIYSFHTGGAQFLLGDGSVRFLKATTSIAVVAALVTRAGGEVVGDY